MRTIERRVSSLTGIKRCAWVALRFAWLRNRSLWPEYSRCFLAMGHCSGIPALFDTAVIVQALFLWYTCRRLKADKEFYP
jgi:hypothetical protein